MNVIKFVYPDLTKIIIPFTIFIISILAMILIVIYFAKKELKK